MAIESEFGWIDRIKGAFPILRKGVLGIGDDAALIEKNLLITTDALVDHAHFLSDQISMQDLGYKSMAVNISDIAAMGGYPLYALLTLGTTKDQSDKDLEQLIQGMQEARELFPFDLIGGDTVRSDTFFLSITLLGKPFRKPLLRSGAKDGDIIYVTGSVGDSAIGLSILQNRFTHPVLDPAYFLRRHYRPTPRVRLMEYLTQHCQIHAAIDISDGLLADLGHIGEMSHKGFQVYGEQVPMSWDSIGSMDDPLCFFQYGWSGGEDYEILFTSHEAIDGDRVFQQTGTRITPIGRILPKGCHLLYHGQEMDWSTIPKGFVHF